MSDHLPMRFYLEPSLRERAESGAHPFVKLMQETVEKFLFRVEFHDLPPSILLPDVHALCHMVKPDIPRALIFRRVYEYPFWQIEQTSERWNWDTAKATFDPARVSGDAARFYGFWQRRLFDDAVKQTRQRGYIYVPLQGRLLQKRSFQKCSPLDMIGHCLIHAPDRQIIATLHPKEAYGAAELAALETLARQNPRLEIAKGDMVRYLQDCDFVVSQNSGAAFSGLFFGKPALLFAGIDFHHIAIKANMDDLQKSFDQVAIHQPDYAAYIWWFWQSQSINAGKDDARDRIAARLRRFGWPMD
ncbi:hypothetical protein [Sulfitobacter sp. JB4-11]|uniref:hypothetical protein n=1 Tax=Sulfitobacter rhodophyticola TaxID=3238304 RepID=UPI003515A4D7